MHGDTRARATLRLLSVALGGMALSASAQTAVENGLADPSQQQATGQGACVSDTWAATTLADAPSPRVDHTAVWTGTEMIIWGGRNDDGVLDTGARYDPAADTWTGTSMAGAPSARAWHTAVWTGTEMIVWGGETSSGARYDPSTDTWTPTSRVGVPLGRRYHAAVWTGTEMIVWGGDAVDFGRYDPATDTWATADDYNQTRFPSAVWTGTEMIVWGGFQGSGFEQDEMSRLGPNFPGGNRGRRYDPAYGSWTSTSLKGAPSGRRWHTGIWTGSEMIVWGGDPHGKIEPALDTGGRYDPLSDTWAATRTGAGGRYQHTAVWTGKDMIIWGGQGAGNAGERYYPTIDSWVAISGAGAPTARYEHTAVWTGTEMIVWGGHYGSSPFNTGGRYCADTGP